MIKINPFSQEWTSIRRQSMEDIEKYRLELESLIVTPDRANQLRGMIFALRSQIEAVEPTPAPTPKEPSYG